MLDSTFSAGRTVPLLPGRPHDRSGRLLAWVVLLGLALTGANASTAGAAEDKPWVLGGTLAWGIHSQGIDGQAVSSTGGGLFEDNGDSLITGFFRLGGRLYTPLRADDLMFKPRLFLTASVYLPVAENLISNAIDQTFNRTDSPTLTDANCAQLPTPGGGTVAPDSCTIRVRNRVTMNAMWSAGAGVDLTLPIAEEQFHLLSSFEYFGQAVQGGGEFERNSLQGNQNSFIEAAESVGDSVIFHGIATALGLYVDVYEAENYKIQLHLEGRAGWKYTERDMRDTAFGPGGISVVFASQVQNFYAQGNGGISLFWTGF